MLSGNVTRKQPLIPAMYFCRDPRLNNWVRRVLVGKYAMMGDPAVEFPPADADAAVITESIAHTAVPYYLILGVFEGKYISLMVDEGLRNMFEVPVIADREFFRGGAGNSPGTIVFGDLIWEYPVVGGGGGNASGNNHHTRVIPRQCFFVNRLFKVAGVEIAGARGEGNPGATTTTWTTAEYTLLRNLFDPLGADVLQNPRAWYGGEARKLASTGNRKIVCAGTCFGLIFKPRKWFPVSEKETMERIYLPNLRYEIDQPLRWVAGNLSTPTDLVHLQLQVNYDEGLDLDWRIYYRTAHWDKIDATLGGNGGSGLPHPPIIFLPNELIMRWVSGRTAANVAQQLPLIIVLVRLSVAEGLPGQQHYLEAETVAIRSEKALPDSEAFIRASCEHVVKLHTNAA